MSELPAALASVQYPPHLVEVLEGLRRVGARAFVVGGSVRDLLLGKTPQDYDVATSARPEEVQRAFKKVIPTGVLHGTVTVVVRGEHVEVTTFRTEGVYVDGRRPSSVTFETEIEADLSRRDFTINAMAHDGAKDFRDPFGGQQDLQLARVRCVGVARERFTEDGLRALRAVRFASVLGFSIEPQTLAAIPQALDSFRKISSERIREEFSKLLLSAPPSEGLQLLLSTGLLGEFLPEVCVPAADPAWQRTRAMVAQVPAQLTTRLAAVLSSLSSDPQGSASARAALVRLTYPHRAADEVALWLKHLGRLTSNESWTDPAIRRFVAELGTDTLDPLWSLAEARFHAERRPPDPLLRAREHFARVLASQPPLTPRQLALKGAEVMQVLGVEPSAVVGEATRFLLAQVLEDPSVNTPQKLSDALRNWAKTRGS